MEMTKRQKREHILMQQRKFHPILQKMASGIDSAEHASRIRWRLNFFIRELPYGYKWAGHYFIEVLKDRFNTLGSAGYEKHIVTDHAFVRALERVYGLDINLLKTLVMKEVMANEKYEFGGKEGLFLTVLPKIMARHFQ